MNYTNNQQNPEVVLSKNKIDKPLANQPEGTETVFKSAKSELKRETTTDTKEIQKRIIRSYY